jgi:hypothetical protein
MSTVKLAKSSKKSDRTKNVDAQSEEAQEEKDNKASKAAYALLKKTDDELKQAPSDMVKYLVEKHPFEENVSNSEHGLIVDMVTTLETVFSKDYVAMDENESPFCADLNNAGDKAMVAGDQKDDVVEGICAMAKCVLRMVIYAAVRGKELFPNTKTDPSPSGKKTPSRSPQTKKTSTKTKKNLVTYAAARLICK